MNTDTQKQDGGAVASSDLLGALPELKEWLTQLQRFGGEITVEKKRVKLRTPRYEYSITAHKDGRGYLGCIASCRVPREGETWLRGSDLADGPYSAETWQSILADIVAYELEAPNNEVRDRHPEGGNEEQGGRAGGGSVD